MSSQTMRIAMFGSHTRIPIHAAISLFLLCCPDLIAAFVFSLATTVQRRRHHVATVACHAHQKVVATCTWFGGDVYNNPCGNGSTLKVPAFTVATDDNDAQVALSASDSSPVRLGLEALIPGAFILRDAVPHSECEEMIDAFQRMMESCRGGGGDGDGDGGDQRLPKDVAQVTVSHAAAERLCSIVSQHVNLDVLFEMSSPRAHDEKNEADDIRYTITGISDHWKIRSFGHRYGEKVGVKSGVDPSAWMASNVENMSKENGISSRFTVILYLNDDFQGGQSQFLSPEPSHGPSEFTQIASLKPKAGTILVFPQPERNQTSTEYAQKYLPMHVHLPVSGGKRPKYVVMTELLVTADRGLSHEEIGNPLFQYDALVRQAFLPRSPIVNDKYASQLSSLYNPHMGVENAGPLLYSIVRFTKPRKIVEIGAGYTSLWLLQALKDNDDEMQRIFHLQKQNKCRLLDYPWSVEDYVNHFVEQESSLLCIDNCLHQRETATGAARVALNLGLDRYFRFVQGDAYDMQFEQESIDLLWCDFGVGSRMRDFAGGAWKSIRPGGFLICHSTLTNQGTRDWLEDVRARKDVRTTGIPPDEVVEMSFLEPTKRYQNSVTILQRRKAGQKGKEYVEPIYSKYA